MSSRFKVGEEVIYFTRHGAWKTSIVSVDDYMLFDTYEVSSLLIRYVKEGNLRKDNKLNRKLYNIKETYENSTKKYRYNYSLPQW